MPTKAKRDSKNYNKGQYLGTYQDIAKVKVPKGTKVTHIKDVIKLVRAIQDQSVEYAVAVSLLANNTVSGVRVVGIGSNQTGVIGVANVFRGAVLDGASGVIFIHNHPNGDTNPSKEDRQVTKRLSKAGEILEVDLLDSIVVSGKKWKSVFDKKKKK